MKHQEILTAYVTAFVDELTKAGVTDVVISPGSRSTPLAYVMAEHSGMNIHINIDERSAAFFALGMAKEKRQPVALLCTSGTAAANYFPAVVESYYARVPLIVLTADRPHELRDVGAPQAIDQLHLYGKHVKWFVEMSLPESEERSLEYARTIAGRAAGTAVTNPAGPVHLNFPFREPLIPDLDQVEKWVDKTEPSKTMIELSWGNLNPSPAQMNEFSRMIQEHKRGIIVCGPIDNLDFSEAVFELSKQTGYPILADPLSQLRSTTHPVIDTYDTFLREEAVSGRLIPEIVIRFGAMPVSKALTLFLKNIPKSKQIVVDGGNGWREPTGRISHMVYCDESAFCLALGRQIGKNDSEDWLTLWTKVNEVTRSGLSMIRDEETLQEDKLFSLLESMLPAETNLMVGNSMPIRNIDTYFHKTEKQIRIFGNRGANGIDGVVSTALGIDAASSRPTVLAIGDLSFYHDMNGLLAAKMYDLKPLILLVNNDGGGIFSYLPQSKEERHFETLFGTPHGLRFEHAAQLYGAHYVNPNNWTELVQAIFNWRETLRFTILEMNTDRHYDVEAYRNLLKKVSREIRMAMNGYE